MAPRVSDRDAMIAQMSPTLDPALYVFCSWPPDRDFPKDMLGFFLEDEGPSVILTVADAGQAGLEVEPEMMRITLMVNSALDGVGLTAAVTSALADAGIACNMVAAYLHDHAFVPRTDAGRAMEILKSLSQSGVTA